MQRQTPQRALLFGSSLRRFAYVTACFPVCTLSACFLYSIAFSYSTVNTTICKVRQQHLSTQSSLSSFLDNEH